MLLESYQNLFLHILISEIRGPTSWKYLLPPNETYCPTFKKVVEKWGFLENDNSIHECLVEASSLQNALCFKEIACDHIMFL